MHGRIPRTFWAVVIAFAASAAGAAEAPSAWVTDATLNDVQFVGTRHVVAVGEHGAIWKSEDGGRKWTRLNCGLDVSLRSVCFITPTDGWIAGHDLVPYSSQNTGVLLGTTDGGETWQKLAKNLLPALHYVKFFGPEEGIAVGQPNSLAPAGIFKTADGGKTWTGVRGNVQHGWKACSFVQPELGVVAGVNGRVSMMGGDQLFESNMPPRGLRSIRTVRLSSSETGWLAGDGGLVLKTSNGGVVWESPTTSLPDAVRENIDFRALDVREEHVWLAGSPGSVVWHSPDGGNRWEKQSTGETSPISAIRFASGEIGIAVGAFGTILRTEDGGKFWKAVQGNGRRAGLLAIHARSSQVSPELIAKVSGESGYRSAVWVAQRNDVGPLSSTTEGEACLDAAVHKCGGNASEIYWQLPLNVPGSERSVSKLIDEWQKQTEGRLTQSLMGSLVRQLRTWRPSVIVIDQPSPDDAACQLLYDTIQRAAEQAADANQFVEHDDVASLPAWKVDRIYMRLTSGAVGDSLVELDEFLPHLKTSTRLLASKSNSLLRPGEVPRIDVMESNSIAYRSLAITIGNKGRDVFSNDAASRTRTRDFFAGLTIQPGSDARRESHVYDESDQQRVIKLIQKQRNFTAISQKSLDDPRISGQLLAQLKNVIQGMDARQAVCTLRDLANEHRKRSQFELAEATYAEMVRLYPQEPESIDAARWLIQLWSSCEVGWQRNRKAVADSNIQLTSATIEPQSINPQVEDFVLGDDGHRAVPTPVTPQGTKPNSNLASPRKLSANLDVEELPSNGKKPSNSARMKIQQAGDSRTGELNEWHARAAELAKQLEVLAPELYRSAEIQFPLAAMRRASGAPRAADAIMRSIAASNPERTTKSIANRELWTSFETPETPEAYAICERTAIRPQLDGLLSDRCWEAANEIFIRSGPAPKNAVAEIEEAPQTIVMFSYDHQYFYFSCSVKRVEGPPRDPSDTRGRLHDADLSKYDRLTIRLDLDRDYATWYEFEVDQRGWTSESCWEDRRWNPKWFVAAESDEAEWRIEAAIPWSELCQGSPKPGTYLGVSILRTVPTVGLQSWTQPATLQVRPSSFGLIKLE